MAAVGNLMNINLTLLWSCPLMNINNSKLLYWKRKEKNFHSCWKKKHQQFLTFKDKIPLKIAEKKWSIYPCCSVDALLLAMGNYKTVVLLKKCALSISDQNWGPIIDILVQFEKDFNTCTKCCTGWMIISDLTNS